MNFGEAVAASGMPGTTLLLEPWVFADEWDSKPDAAVCVGLRLLADKEKSKARFTAEELADQLHPQRDAINWVDAYNDALMRQIAALAVCDPNDVRKPAEVLPMAELTVSDALTSRGARFIFESVAQYEIQASPIGEEASAETLQRLGALLQHTDTEVLPPGLRRLLAHVTDELDDRFGHLVDGAAGVDHAGDEVPIIIGKH